MYKDKKDKLLDKRRIAALVSFSIRKKYSKLRSGPSRLTVYINSIITKVPGKSLIEKHLFAEHLVKSCLQYRESYKSDFVKKFASLRTSLLATLTKASETASHSQIHDVLCGQGFHTSTTESFFPKTSYSPEAFDIYGKLLVTKFPSYTANGLGTGTDSWKCSSTLCRIPPVTDVNLHITTIYTHITKLEPLEARHFIQHMDDCMNDRLHDSTLLGHHEVFHSDPVACRSKLLYLRHLFPHYPNLRRIVNMLYNIRQVDNKLCSIDCALTTGNVADLEQIVKEHKQSKSSYAVYDDGIDENKVMEEYIVAIVAFKKRRLELPEFPCMSCNKFCFRRECIKLDHCLKPVTGENWQRLLDYIDSHPGFDDGLSDGYICNYCIVNFGKAFFQHGAF